MKYLIYISIFVFPLINGCKKDQASSKASVLSQVLINDREIMDKRNADIICMFKRWDESKERNRILAVQFLRNIHLRFNLLDTNISHLNGSSPEIKKQLSDTLTSAIQFVKNLYAKDSSIIIKKTIDLSTLYYPQSFDSFENAISSPDLINIYINKYSYFEFRILEQICSNLAVQLDVDECWEPVGIDPVLYRIFELHSNKTKQEFKK